MSKLDEIIDTYWDEIIRGDKLVILIQDEFKDQVLAIFDELVGNKGNAKGKTAEELWQEIALRAEILL